MSLLFRIIYAAHANGTHHKLALDALNDLKNENAEDWRRLILKHSELYLTGSKAPDKEFKDFKNHVLHPGGEYWGGAPSKARNWYDHLVNALKSENWSEAIWCAGVLSHYYTDPIQPFHTAQSKAENEIHRATEWSINRSYNSLRAEGLAKATDSYPTPSPTSRWLEDFVCAGADTSHEYYEQLIAHYDFDAGVIEPTKGLDKCARSFISALLIYASRGFASILDRAFAEADVAPPKVSLTVETFLAAIEIPIKWITNKIENEAERQAVQAIYDELRSTGEVEETLPQEQRTVRTLYNAEVRPKKNAERKKARKRKLAATDEERRTSHNIADSKPTTRRPPQDQRSQATPNTPTKNRTDKQFEKKPYLHTDDDLEKAPAIGAKTASQLADKAGIRTVGEFLAANPDEIAKKLNRRFMTAKTIRNWQAAARLTTEIPGLRGTDAMLLTGAGFSTPESIAKADSAKLSATLLRFSLTPEGSRMLRSGKAPDLNKAKGWIAAAQKAKAA